MANVVEKKREVVLIWGLEGRQKIWSRDRSVADVTFEFT
jgi:hypothetical protein